jgi:hypothetical protein
VIPAPGTRIRLLSMPDDPDPILVGAEGVVVENFGHQIHIKWDNGRSLMLIDGVDTWEEA